MSGPQWLARIVRRPRRPGDVELQINVRAWAGPAVVVALLAQRTPFAGDEREWTARTLRRVARMLDAHGGIDCERAARLVRRAARTRTAPMMRGPDLPKPHGPESRVLIVAVALQRP